VNKEAENNEVIGQAAREFFRQLEQQEHQALLLWKQFREITVEEYQQVYKVLTRPAHL
jgi:arginyl-tRNA synthetase